ncbi:MAG: DUF2157 domain-containing protein [Oceanospirillaceae bacterium]|nr:DUF2157 domain-containing protein [Oceanospirillaceae bacterium]
MQNNRARVLGWVQEGLIEHKDIAAAMQVAQAQPRSHQWRHFIKQLLLWLSVICVCSGVIFFFAYNWQALSRMTRFALVESAMLVVSLSYLRCSGNESLKIALLMAMTLLTGALLALVGQTYQTGADPWQLFIIWSALITPWALLASSSVMWIFWLLLLNLGCVLLFQLNVPLQWLLSSSSNAILLNLVMINTALLVLFELAARFKIRSILSSQLLSPSNRYTQQTLLSVVMYLSCSWAIEGLFSDQQSSYLIFAYFIMTALVYRFVIKDLFAIAVTCLGFLCVSSAFLFHGLDVFHADFLQYLFFGAFYILGASSLMGVYLKRLTQIFNKAEQTVECTDKEQR